jgi:AraC-like DNA-binding protein
MNLLQVLSSDLFRAHIVFQGFACGRWGLAPSQSGRLGFHLVLAGECWAQSPDLPEPVLLRAGGIMIFQPPVRYALTDGVNRTDTLAPTRIVPLGNQPDERHVGLLCGYFDAGGANGSWLSVLPTIQIWRDKSACTPQMSALVEAINKCAGTETASNYAILQRLCEVLLVAILKTDSVTQLERPSLARAASHPALRLVLLAMHARPANAWTVQSLSSVARLSRSGFAELFKQQSGLTPLGYLRNYRMALAQKLLGADGANVKRVAHSVGYQNVPAFRRQFAKASDAAVRLTGAGQIPGGKW